MPSFALIYIVPNFNIPFIHDDLSAKRLALIRKLLALHFFPIESLRQQVYLLIHCNY